ncbi:hypothetical protein DFJ73DRAFT_763638 [Zopfochytrium polystomum]|nr:hypothetical protein DFJ73DRAFT_763638 [Zopfochytrium polystomum]
MQELGNRQQSNVAQLARQSRALKMYQQMLTDKWLPFVVTFERQHYHVYMLLPSGDEQRKRVLRITMARGIERKVVRIVFQVPDTGSFEILAKTTAVTPCSEVDVFPQLYAGMARSLPGYGPGLELVNEISYVGFTEAMQRGYDIAKVSNSADLVSWVIGWLLCNNPDVVFIHFGFSYDIPVLAAHAPHILDQYFEARNLGAVGKGVDLVLPQTVVVDTFRYADKVVDWSSDRYASKVVSGARVLQPKRGYYTGLLLMDFASMYPTIMASVNISAETVHDLLSEMQGTHAPVSSQLYVPFKRRSAKRALRSLVANGQIQEGAVYWDQENTYIGISGRVARIDCTRRSSAAIALQTLIERRTQVGKSTEPGWALKVAANSMYGSSVTTIGRWLITVVEAVSYMLGYDIIYKRG